MLANVIAGYAAVVATLAILIPIWQARRARHPDIELGLIHTAVGDVQMVTLEVRNRGDYPIRIITVGIAGPRISYTFALGQVEVAHLEQGRSTLLESDDSKLIEASDGAMTPIPGIVLPRDAGSRFITNDTASALPEPNNDLDREFVSDVAASLSQEMTGYVDVSTGEHFETKPVRFDWANFKKV